MPRPPLLVFDLDGTLIDTAPDLMGALNSVLVGQGLPPATLAAVRNMVGHGARTFLERGLLAAGVKLPASAVDALFADFLVHYRAHIADDSVAYPGVVAALDRFAGRGFALAVCTNKLEGLSRSLFAEMGLLDRFAAVVGGDTLAVKKPEAAVLHHTIAVAGGDPGRSIMVGDSATDIDAARAAGLPVVAVDYGYTSVPVSQLGPDRIISHFDDLDHAVAALLTR